MQEENVQFIEGKVDWKGNTARKDKHGGTRTSLLILGNAYACVCTDIN